jgi:3-oxoadipate enol-lactonase
MNVRRSISTYLLATALAAGGTFAGAQEMVQTTSGKLAVYVSGRADGTPVVLWPSIFGDSSMYEQLAEALGDRHRVLRVDGPGHGASGPAPRGTTIVDHGPALIDILDAYGLEQAAVVGTSWGGMAAGWAALAAPERVSRIAFLNTPFFIGEDSPPMSSRMIVFGGRLSLRSRMFRNGVARSFFMPETIEANPPALEAFHEHLQNADRRALMAAVRSVLLAETALAPRLPEIGVPALVVAGRHDEMYPLERMQQTADALPNGRLVVLETSHISVIDAAEETNALVSEFLLGP